MGCNALNNKGNMVKMKRLVALFFPSFPLLKSKKEKRIRRKQGEVVGINKFYGPRAFFNGEEFCA